MSDWMLVESKNPKYKDTYFIAKATGGVCKDGGRKLKWIGKAYQGRFREAVLFVHAQEMYEILEDFFQSNSLPDTEKKRVHDLIHKIEKRHRWKD